MTDQEFLPYGRQCIGEEEIAAVVEVLRGDWLTTGPKVEAFEQAAIEATGAKHAVCCSSGTAGLHLAAMAARLGTGHHAVVPSVTFLATANAVRFTGAEVLFADVEPETGLMTPETMMAALETASRDSLSVEAVLPVHLTGQDCKMSEIGNLAADNNLFVIEDAAQALGASYAYEGGVSGTVGDCRFSDLAVFSTHPVKSITTGEGGIVTTSDDGLAGRLAMLRSHGMRRDDDAMANRDLAFDNQGKLNPWYYEMHELAPNYRLTDLQCALGVAQFRNLRHFIERRRELARHYDTLLADLVPAVTPLARQPGSQSAFHIYVVRIDFDGLRKERSAVMANLKEQGIGSQVHFIPVHHQPYYRDRYGDISLPGADAYYRRALTLPLFVGMTEVDVERVVEALIPALGLGAASGVV